MVDGAMDADLVEPGRQSRAQVQVEAVEGVEGLDERILDDVFGVFREAEVAEGEPEDPVAIPKVDLLQGVRTPLLGHLDHHLFGHSYSLSPR